jgi:hypothetical protein
MYKFLKKFKKKFKKKIGDLDTISTIGELNDIIDILADEICYWNINVKYSEKSGDCKTHGNCQDVLF